MSTPIIVAEVTSRRRSGLYAKHHRGHHQPDGHEDQRQVGAHDARDDVLKPDLVRRESGEADAEYPGDAERQLASQAVALHRPGGLGIQ
jgi:hypothetical protein